MSLDLARSCRSKRGPTNGYANPAKNAWRNWVWNNIEFDRQCSRAEDYIDAIESHTPDLSRDEWLHLLRNLPQRNVLFMPSVEGWEISEALQRGLSPAECHVCDEKVGVVASLQKRFKGIATYGVRIDNACERIARNGTRIVAANLDFCSQASRTWFDELCRCWDSGALDRAVVYVTILRGREDELFRRQSPIEKFTVTRELRRDDWWISPQKLKPTALDVWRLCMIRRSCNNTRMISAVHAYTSPNGQSFLTALVHPKEWNALPETARDSQDWSHTSEGVRFAKAHREPMPQRLLRVAQRFGANDWAELAEKMERAFLEKRERAMPYIMMLPWAAIIDFDAVRDAMCEVVARSREAH